MAFIGLNDLLEHNNGYVGEMADLLELLVPSHGHRITNPYYHLIKQEQARTKDLRQLDYLITPSFYRQIYDATI